jgi:hypothetical protein
LQTCIDNARDRDWFKNDEKNDFSDGVQVMHPLLADQPALKFPFRTQEFGGRADDKPPETFEVGTHKCRMA